MAGSVSWGTSSVTVHPASLAKHPNSWTKEEVGVWLRWCTEEYSIEPVLPEKFDLNGKALCLLSRGDFMERVPKNGDVLFNSLYTLISKQTGILNRTPIQLTPKLEPHYTFKERRSPTTVSPIHQEAVGSNVLIMPQIPGRQFIKSLATMTTDSLHSTHYVPIRPQSFISSTRTSHPDDRMKPFQTELVKLPGSMESLSYPICSIGTSSESDRSFVDVFRQDRSSECRLLWEFIYQLLSNTKFSSFVCWENEDEHVFRIINPTGLAELWGQQKNRTNMTYEKLSRALRYYYRMNIIKKVPGKRLTYRFLQSPDKIQKGQRGAKPQYKLPIECRDKRDAHKISEELDGSMTLKTKSDDAPSVGSNTMPGQLEDPEDSEDLDGIQDDDDGDYIDEIGESNIETLNIPTGSRTRISLLETANTCISNDVMDHVGSNATLQELPMSESLEDKHKRKSPYRNDVISVPECSPLEFPHPSQVTYNTFLAPSASHVFTTLRNCNRRDHSSSNSTDTHSRSPPSASSFGLRFTHPFYDMNDPAAMPYYRDFHNHERFSRSRSCDFAQFSNFRPLQPRSVSPRLVIQNEPEDLSIRSRSNSTSSVSPENIRESRSVFADSAETPTTIFPS